MIKINLSKLLGEQRIKQADLSRATGIRKATISNIYNESVNSLTLKQLNSICKYLNCTVGELFEYVPDK
ncbi:MAG: helix-turn-helix transcriptional regulator [Oscillospiraceae bacterium]